LRFSSGLHYAWEFQENQQRFEVRTRGMLASDDFNCLIQAAADGAGICYTYQEYAREFVKQGKLQAILESYQPAGERMYLYYPSRINLPLSLRALIDFTNKNKDINNKNPEKNFNQSATVITG